MKTVEKALRLLRTFTKEEPELGVSELARRLGLDRATVHRLLRSLLAERFVRQDSASRRYRLGTGILDVAAVWIGQHGLMDIAPPHLERLREVTGETVAVLVPDGGMAVCLTALESRHAVRVGYAVGERIPMHASAGGQVLLAHLGAEERAAVIAAGLAAYTRETVTDPEVLARVLDEIRARRGGWSAQGYIEGVISAAAPVMDPSRRLAGAIAIAAPLQRRPAGDLNALFEAARDAADAISAEWAGQRPRPAGRIA